jgi:hypothetical protein
MPFKDPDRKREYFRYYMRVRRGRENAPLNPSVDRIEVPPATDNASVAKYDPRRAHRHTMTKIDGKWIRTVEQEGLTYDRDTGELINVPP